MPLNIPGFAVHKPLAVAGFADFSEAIKTQEGHGDRSRLQLLLKLF